MARTKDGHGRQIERIENVKKQQRIQQTSTAQRVSKVTQVSRVGEREKAGKKTHADQYKSGSLIPKFLRSVSQRQKSSWIYQTFRLPGTDYVVRDLRAGGSDDEVKAHLKKEQDLGAFKTEAKNYSNFLGDRSDLRPKEGKSEKESLSRLLSDFEKLLVERFEKGKLLEILSKDGKACYREKSDDEWREFFGKFGSRSILKSISDDSLKEIVYRGQAKPKNNSDKFTLIIGDIILESGDLDKFARLKVLSQIAGSLIKGNPGDIIQGKNLMQVHGDKNPLCYMAISHKHDREDIKRSMQESKGMFGLLKSEQEAAEKLGLKKAYKGSIGWKGKSSPKNFVPEGFGKKEPKSKATIPPMVFIALAFFLIIILLIILTHL